MKPRIIGTTFLISLLCACTTPSTTPTTTAKYQYQYTLYTEDEEGSTTIAQNTPYYLAIEGHSEISNKSKQIYTTDAQGKTQVIYSDTPIHDEDVTLAERYGSGPLGEIYHLVDQNKNPIQGFHYTILIQCPNKLEQKIKGITNQKGYTKYVATQEVCNLKIFDGGY